MNTTTGSVTTVLNTLVETCRDGQEGFRSAADHVQNAELKSLFSELSEQRGQFMDKLRRIVEENGEAVDGDGSVSGALHRGWINLKSAMTGGDEHAILAECERGEDSAVAEYREALEHEEFTGSTRVLLQQQYTAVQAAHDRVRDLRDGCKA